MHTDIQYINTEAHTLKRSCTFIAHTHTHTIHSHHIHNHVYFRISNIHYTINRDGLKRLLLAGRGLELSRKHKEMMMGEEEKAKGKERRRERKRSDHQIYIHTQIMKIITFIC